ncbi:hypothetical protein HMI54_010246 [Coelomomyces lativittatus]|nr:hypothetical protein HMI55_001493 [Coelomomyces lativittatus]KAJ1510975.1 hypothetical protein HMI56_005976 [Coelomomyces lativittatus]KAJ1516254.1 hypothetical protein HMI54_010246 [Coelomomyces lativittatus]
MKFSLRLLLIFIVLLQCRLSSATTIKASTFEDIFTDSFSINSAQQSFSSICDEPLESFLGTVVLTEKNSGLISHVGLSGYSKKEFPLTSEILVSSSSFDGIKNLGDLHERHIKFFFEIKRGYGWPSLSWCVYYKITVPEQFRENALHTISEIEKNMDPKRGPQQTFFYITSYNNEFVIDKGVVVGRKTKKQGENLKLVPIRTAEEKNVKAFVHSLIFPEKPVPEEEQPPNQIPPINPEPPTTREPSTPCTPKLSIFQECVIPKCIVRVECKTVKSVSTKSNCQEEVQSKIKLVEKKEEEKAQPENKEVVKKKEEEEVKSQDVQGSKKLANSASTFSFSFVSILLMSVLILW